MKSLIWHGDGLTPWDGAKTERKMRRGKGRGGRHFKADAVSEKQ